MNWFLKIVNGFYRAWFYVMIAVATIVLFPFLFIFTIKESYYSKFYVVARMWGGIILYGMGLFPKVKRIEKLQKNKPYILVANHSSMTDIMLMYCAVRSPFVYVGKQELAKIPVFGFFYKRSSILVDRSNMRSKNAVFGAAQRRIAQGNSVCLFPEGGVPEDSKPLLGKFKDGPFRMAIDHQIPVVPLIFYDNKRRFPYHFEKAHPGRLRVKILPAISTDGMDARKDKRALRDRVRQIIHDELKHPDF